MGSTATTRRLGATVCLAAAALIAAVSPVAGADRLDWSRQFGGPESDYGFAVAVDGDANAYVAGETWSALDGDDLGFADAYLRSYDPAGGLRWGRQFGGPFRDRALDVDTDADGNVYVAGDTQFSIDSPDGYDRDLFVHAFTPSGELRWTHRFGPGFISGIGVDDAGNVVVAGYGAIEALDGADLDGTGMVVRALTADGTVRWTHQFGPGLAGGLSGGDVAIDERGEVYLAAITGITLTGEELGGLRDAFVRKYDADGQPQWTRQIGPHAPGAFNVATSVAALPGGGAVVGGSVSGELVDGTHSGGSDGFVRTYRPDGSIGWTHQFPSSGDSVVEAVTVGPGPTVIAVGSTGTEAGTNASFVALFDPDGTLRHLHEFGDDPWTPVTGVAATSDGAIYVTGYTFGDLTGEHAGGTDGFLIRFARPVVEPPPVPVTKGDCKRGRWRHFEQFRNQGQCVSWVQASGRRGR
jgi:hypothetical protein